MLVTVLGEEAQAPRRFFGGVGRADRDEYIVGLASGDGVELRSRLLRHSIAFLGVFILAAL